MAEKKCNKCLRIKSFDCFQVRSNGRYGLEGRCKECHNERKRKWAEVNRDKRRSYWVKWRSKNLEKSRHIARQSARKLYSTPSKKICILMRNAVKDSLNRRPKSLPTFKALGYSRDELIQHLEAQFIGGMSWENYGQWHVDHIVPLASFRIESMECKEFKAAWALSNLRPLWAHENKVKSDKRLFLL